MTLFLGILNYVAEKRQGIIAENIGFWIIALTAHTEEASLEATSL